MKIRSAPMAVACALMVAASAQATSLTYNFGGTLQEVQGGLPLLAAGDSFAGSFTIDSAALDLEPASTVGFYTDGFSINVTVNGYSFSSSASASCVSCNAVAVGDGPFSDVLQVRGGIEPFLIGPNLGDFLPYAVSVDLRGGIDVFSSDALPLNAPLSSLIFERRFEIQFTRVGENGGRAFGDLTYFNVAAPPVPEASTSAMLALGLGALAFVRRRQAS